LRPVNNKSNKSS